MKKQNIEKASPTVSMKVVIAILVVAVAILGTVLIIVLNNQKNGGTESTQGEPQRNFVDENNVDSIMTEVADKVAEGMFECKMTTSWTFDDGKSASANAYVANAETNNSTIYFDVYLADTEEIIYSSPYLKVGQELTDIKLDKDLEPGEYDAVVEYSLVDEDYNVTSTAGFSITISVLE